jgi:Arc/MetJ-type ribon-helix-helix transcriptional regulator
VEFVVARVAINVGPNTRQSATIDDWNAAMTIDLKPEQQRVIDLAVQSGAYQSPDEVLDQAFEIIREQLGLEDWMLGQREQISAHIAAGFAQAERGELMDGDAAVEILRRRRATRLKQRE